ncbi:matrixin family metalloprotease [Aquipuribacter sp. MA13-6]|uniref:matrixin family metalloprotease n=1 Tax=unclassified Aquipuribacter TaxID=2635084 RepID=UPI003EECA9ED
MTATATTSSRLLVALLTVLLCSGGALGVLLVDQAGGPTASGGQPLATPPQVPDPGGYTFLATTADGDPVRWDPCRPVQVVVRPDGEPPGGREAVVAALADVGTASGLVLQVEGETDEAPSVDRPGADVARYGDRWSPVLLAWSDGSEHPPLAGALGVAGPVASAPGPGAGATSSWVSGTVVLDATWFGDNLAHATGARRAAAVLRHEVAHLVGLGHSQDPFSLMSPAYQSVFEPSLSDRAGLARLGGGPCS